MCVSRRAFTGSALVRVGLLLPARCDQLLASQVIRRTPCAPYRRRWGIGMFSRLAHSNRLRIRMFQAIALPLANRRRLSPRTNRQCSWCRRVYSAPKMLSIRALFLYSLPLSMPAAFLLCDLPRLTASFRCLMLGIMLI